MQICTTLLVEKMDKRLQEVANARRMDDDCDIFSLGVELGFEFAIQRLRENEYYGHYAQSLANWLDKHLSQEVTSDKATDK